MADEERTTDQSGPRVIGVVGSDEFTLDLMYRMPQVESGEWKLVPILKEADVQPPSRILDFDRMYTQACREIDAMDTPPEALVGHLDFPVTALVSVLNRRYGLRGASPEAVARCEHKYWMRLEQKKAMPDRTPEVHAVNPFEPEDAKKEAPPFPFWIKPVKGHSSILGYKVKDEATFEWAMHQCRQLIHIYGEPFNQFLAHLDEDAGQPKADGNYAVIEEMISTAQQFTLECYMKGGEATAYGVINTMRTGPADSSMSAYIYPGELPEKVVERAQEIAETVLRQMKYDDAPFNIEFFWDPETDDLNLLEINTRLSRSHSPMFHMVDGASHHQQIIELALGQEPEPPRRAGRVPVAAKFMVRSFEEDGIVKRIPSQEEVDAMRKLLPDLMLKMWVHENDRLSQLTDQDSFSYELYDLFIGGADQEVLQDAYKRCRDTLELHIKPMMAEES